MSLETPCQAQFLGFDSNDCARAQVAMPVDLELQGPMENCVVVVERKETNHHSQASQEGPGPRKVLRVTWSRSSRGSTGLAMDSCQPL